MWPFFTDSKSQAYLEGTLHDSTVQAEKKLQWPQVDVANVLKAELDHGIRKPYVVIQHTKHNPIIILADCGGRHDVSDGQCPQCVPLPHVLYNASNTERELKVRGAQHDWVRGGPQTSIAVAGKPIRLLLPPQQTVEVGMVRLIEDGASLIQSREVKDLRTNREIENKERKKLKTPEEQLTEYEEMWASHTEFSTEELLGHLPDPQIAATLQEALRARRDLTKHRPIQLQLSIKMKAVREHSVEEARSWQDLQRVLDTQQRLAKTTRATATAAAAAAEAVSAAEAHASGAVTMTLSEVLDELHALSTGDHSLNNIINNTSTNNSNNNTNTNNSNHNSNYNSNHNSNHNHNSAIHNKHNSANLNNSNGVEVNATNCKQRRAKARTLYELTMEAERLRTDDSSWRLPQTSDFFGKDGRTLKQLGLDKTTKFHYRDLLSQHDMEKWRRV